MSLSGLLPKVLFALVFGYIAVATGAWALQDKLIYYPDPTPAGDPKDDRMQAVSFTAADGNDIAAWYGAAQQGCPTFIFFHGNASHIAKDIWRYDRVLTTGAGVLAVAWPGYAGSTGKPGEAPFYSAADASAAWLKAEGVAPGDTIIHGNSIGTGPATRLASTGDFGALILEAPYFSMLDLVGKKAPMLPIGVILKSTFRSDQWIKDVHSPVLMVHGTGDSVIPQKQSRRLFELANDPKIYASFEQSEHSTLVRDGLYEKAVWTFLDEYWAQSRGSSCFSASSTQSETTP